jgi:hypothetical protein
MDHQVRDREIAAGTSYRNYRVREFTDKKYLVDTFSFYLKARFRFVIVDKIAFILVAKLVAHELVYHKV